MRKKVCIIHTGGTIGMARTPHGYAPQPAFIESALKNIHELDAEEMPSFDLVEYSPLLDSSSIGVQEWIKIAKDIEGKYEAYDGFVILHGTDTMAYTASALSFMLEGLNKPVVITGSQIPLCEIRNDGRDNLITALMIAGNYRVPEVCLYFGGKLLRGNRATKVSADDLIAFDSPNYPELAEAGVRITLHENNFWRQEKQEAFKLYPFQEHTIAVIKVFPGIQFKVFENILTWNLKGIVIEGFGAGNIPENHGALLQLLHRAKENGTVIVVCTQCLRGSAILGEYKASRELLEAGAVSGYDMTVEAAVAKLYYLLSNSDDLEMIKKSMEINLRGELTPL